jgi:serine/threonine protein kinase
MAAALDKDNPLAPGTIIDGKFRVDKSIGEGAVGVVMRAKHLKLGQPVAIKFLLPRMLSEAVVVERFAREARASASLTSEHVARILDVGSTEATGPYIVMEYLSGETVSDAVKRLGQLPIADSCTYMMEVCDALIEAHGKGIIHRDLKPANLFLAKRPNRKTIVKVLDFGISKIGADGLGGADGIELTMASSILGTPLYMAPEQISSSRSVDGRADLWSCGVCLHRMLCGAVPFDADSLPMLAAKVLKELPPDLSLLRSDVPRELAQVVIKCLQRDVTKRWQNATELMNALSRFGAPRTISSTSNPMLNPDELETIRRRRPIRTSGSSGRSRSSAPPPPPPHDDDPGFQPEDEMETQDLAAIARHLGQKRPSYRPSHGQGQGQGHDPGAAFEDDAVETRQIDPAELPTRRGAQSRPAPAQKTPTPTPPPPMATHHMRERPIVVVHPPSHAPSHPPQMPMMSSSSPTHQHQQPQQQSQMMMMPPGVQSSSYPSRNQPTVQSRRRQEDNQRYLWFWIALFVAIVSLTLSAKMAGCFG